MRRLIHSAMVLISSLLAPHCEAQFVVAHRGASHDAPENTLAAFRLAWEQQADAIEGDFYLTKDGQIVCIHDETTKRTAPGQPVRTVADATLAELQTLDVGRWKHAKYAGERIPTLHDVLAAVPAGRKLFVEIKCGPEILPALKPLLRQSGLKTEQIVIISFDQTVVAQCRRELPEYKANWLTSYKAKDKQNEQAGWTPSLAGVLASLRQTRATGLGTQGNLKVVDKAFAEQIAAAGVELHAWTINDPREARQLAALGAASITTDKPQLIRDALRRSATEGAD